MISVIMPAYNKVQNISSAIEDTVNALEKYGLEYEVIVVDDGSNDGTYDEVASVAKEHVSVKVFGYKENKGKGFALRYGFQFAQGDLVLFLDADSDLPPSQIPLFLDRMVENNIDIVIGSKRHPLSEVKYPLLRRFLSRGYSLLITLMFNLNTTDTQVGIKLFRKDVLDQVLPKLLVKKFAFDVELLANAKRLGYSITEVPVVLDYNHVSRINLRDIWYIFLDTLAIFYRMKILHYYDRR